MSKGLNQVIQSISEGVKGRLGDYLPPIIFDDTPEDVAARIRAGQRLEGPPVIRYRGVSLAEYEKREQDHGKTTERGWQTHS